MPQTGKVTVDGVFSSGKRTLVMQATTGTLKANAMARCSFDIPIKPAFAPTIKITQDGAPDVSPYNVVFRYRSWPARSKHKAMSIPILVVGV